MQYVQYLSTIPIFFASLPLFNSVIGNLSLALVTATMSFRIYKSVLAAVNKNQEGHPFKVRLFPTKGADIQGKILLIGLLTKKQVGQT